DAELSDDERLAFVERLAVDASLRSQVAFAEQVSLSLAAIPQPAAPDSLIASLDAISRGPGLAAAGVALRQAPLRPLRFLSSLRPALGIAASVLALVFAGALAVTNLSRQEGVQVEAPAISQTEVDRALREVKYAFAVVSEAGRHTGVAVRESVFEEQSSVDRP